MKILIPILLISLFMDVLPQQRIFNIGNFKLESGAVLEDCEIGFRTFGEPNEDSSNAIIFPTWFEGRSGDLERLIKKHNFIDTSKFYVIAFDALGDGISTSPSNYAMYDSKNFPCFSVRDMVNSQYQVLRKLFKLDKIYGAIGGSMGGMQVLEWAVAYPDYVEKIFSYVGTPRLSSFDLFVMNSHIELIKVCWEYKVPEEKIKPLLDMFLNQLAYTPDYRNRVTSRDEFHAFFDSFSVISENEFRVVDYYYQMDAMLRHDISRATDFSMDSAASSIKADLFILVSERDLLVNPARAIEFARTYGFDYYVLKNDCGHIGPSCELEKTREMIDEFFSN